MLSVCVGQYLDMLYCFAASRMQRHQLNIRICLSARTGMFEALQSKLLHTSAAVADHMQLQLSVKP